MLQVNLITFQTIGTFKSIQNVKKSSGKGRIITRSEDLMSVSSRESLLMLSWWNSMRCAQGRDLSRRWLILSEETSTTTALWLVSAMSFSQRCDPMKPPPPIMHIDSIGIVFPSRFTLAIAATKICAVSEEKKLQREREREREEGCGSYNWFFEGWKKEGSEKAVAVL